MPHSIKIIIVEDEELYRLNLEAFILELGFSLVGSTSNSEKAIQLIIDQKPDIVIMDINIEGKLNGIEVAEKLSHVRTSFLFITSLKEKEIYQQAKQTAYVGYLIKPFDEVSLQSAIELALRKRTDASLTEDSFKEWSSDILVENSILIKHNRQLYKVLLSDILYIESRGKVSVIHTKEKNFVSNTTLYKFLIELPENLFIQIHKSIIINVKHFQKAVLKDNEVFINDTSLPIGRVYKEKFLQRFNIY